MTEDEFVKYLEEKSAEFVGSEPLEVLATFGAAILAVAHGLREASILSLDIEGALFTYEDIKREYENDSE